MQSILALVLLSGWGRGLAAQTGISDIQIVKGACGADSNISEGPIGSDLSKRESRFYCDTAAITFFTDSPNHILIDFTERGSHHSPMIGFSGMTDEAGILLNIEKVYLSTGDPATVSEGSCKLFFKAKRLVGIACGMRLDEAGRRTAAIVEFDAEPGQ